MTTQIRRTAFHTSPKASRTAWTNPSLLSPSPCRDGNDPEEDNHHGQSRKRRPGRDFETPAAHDIGDVERPEAEGERPADVDDRHREAEVPPGVAGHHPGHRGVEHGGADRRQRDEQKETPERVRPADEGHEDDGQERSAQDEEARTVAVGEIAHAGLDDEGEYPHHADEETDLGQRKGVFLDEDRQERADEGEIEIADEMDQRQAEDDLDIGAGRVVHWRNIVVIGIRSGVIRYAHSFPATPS